MRGSASLTWAAAVLGCSAGQEGVRGRPASEVELNISVSGVAGADDRVGRGLDAVGVGRDGWLFQLCRCWGCVDRFVHLGGQQRFPELETLQAALRRPRSHENMEAACCWCLA